MNPRMDVNEKVPSGNTALHAAVNIGSVSMVKLLINAGANVNAWNADCEGATPLHLAVMGGQFLFCPLYSHSNYQGIVSTDNACQERQ